jgi:putative pyoverdin transport system ATP-binding/permease protein
VRLLAAIPRRSWVEAAGAVGAGLLSGLCSAGLIAVISTGLSRVDLSRTLLVAAFVGLVLGKVGANALSRLLLNQFSQRTLTDLCRDLSRQVLTTPLSQLEHIGIPRILATLTEDVAVLGWAAQNIPTITTHAAVLAGCAIYLGWLSWAVLFAVVLFVLTGAFLYRILIARAYRHLERARDTRDLLLQHFRGLTEGMKELKLHAGRRQAFLAERIDAATEALKHDAMAGIRHHLTADAWSQILFYALLGGLVFAAPAASGLSTEAQTGYLLTALYMMPPVWGLMELWPIMARARISLEKVRALGLSLGSSGTVAGPESRPPETRWGRLEFDGVTFAYPPGVDGRAFTLGPIDFALRQGELVFLVGGNGSGKSTFVKVLSGLYSPQLGAIRLNGQAIADKDREGYSEYFSVVFSDFYLFDALLGLRGPDLDARAKRYLIELELDDKVQIKEGTFSTTALSQGQRKRLALLTAFLEDRPIYVFDEWAADQDPHYREIFYRRLLPDLKARGKTVVVISHDDRYYHLGDRIIRLEYGKIGAELSGSPG